MDQETLRKVQLTQLDIFKQVQKVAQANGIAVFLAYGTLLGAVRHRGFIPWDDDIDLFVLREDYDRLMSLLAAELEAPYWLQSYDTDPGYWQGFAKVRKSGTVYKEQATGRLDDSKCGIWIDIFPLDGAGRSGGWGLKLRKLLVETMGFSLQKRLLKRPLSCFSRRYLPLMLLWRPIPIRVLKRWQVRIARRHSRKPTKWLACFLGTDRIEKETFRAQWFSEAAQLPFEDVLCDVPHAYDELLTHVYGDYMTPPPPEARGGHNADGQSSVVV